MINYIPLVLIPQREKIIKTDTFSYIEALSDFKELLFMLGSCLVVVVIVSAIIRLNKKEIGIVGLVNIFTKGIYFFTSLLINIHLNMHSEGFGHGMKSFTDEYFKFTFWLPIIIYTIAEIILYYIFFKDKKKAIKTALFTNIALNILPILSLILYFVMFIYK